MRLQYAVVRADAPLYMHRIALPRPTYAQMRSLAGGAAPIERDDAHWRRALQLMQAELKTLRQREELLQTSIRRVEKHLELVYQEL